MSKDAENEAALRNEALKGMLIDHGPTPEPSALKSCQQKKRGARLKVPYAPFLVGNPDTGVIHGGVITTMLDNACGVATQMALGEPTAIATLDLRIDYMRPATPKQDIQCEAHCFKLTKSVAFVRGTAFHEDIQDPIATCMSAFMLAANRASPPSAGIREKVLGEMDRLSASDRGKGRDMRDLEHISQGRDINEVMASIPYVAFLGITFEKVGDELLGKLTFKQDLIGNPSLPALHGGVIGGFLETAAIVQVARESKIRVLPKTIDITIDYLRSGRPLDTYARATITKHGRRVANVQVIAWQDDPEKPIAAAHGHFLLEPIGDGNGDSTQSS